VSKRIEAIVAAAPGWYATYAQDDKSLNYVPIPVWALVIEEGLRGDPLRYVEGVDVIGGTTELAADMGNFHDYAFLPDGPPPGAEVYPGGTGFSVPADFRWPPPRKVELR